MKYTVDRIINGIAVLEKGDLSHIEISVSDLPQGTKEGSILAFENGLYTLDELTEAERRKKLLEKQNFLLNRTKKD